MNPVEIVVMISAIILVLFTVLYAVYKKKKKMKCGVKCDSGASCSSCPYSTYCTSQQQTKHSQSQLDGQAPKEE